MTLIDIAELPRIILPQLSPDGKVLIYLQSQADWKIGRPVWQLRRRRAPPHASRHDANGAGLVLRRFRGLLHRRRPAVGNRT
jgi:hypothetical protein